MKLRAGWPSDLMALLVWPVVFIVGIGAMAGCAMSVFNWMHKPTSRTLHQADAVEHR